MFRWSLCFFSSLGGVVLRCESVAEAVEKVMTAGWSPIAAVSRGLPDDIQEMVGDEYGGLKNFLLSRPHDYEVRSANRVWQTRKKTALPQAPPAPDVSIHVSSSPPQRSPPAADTVIQLTEIADDIKPLFSLIPTFAIDVEVIQQQAFESLAALTDALRRTAFFDVAFIGSRCFARVSPPYASAARRMDDSPNKTHGHLQVPLHEALRLARLLSVEKFTSLELLEVESNGTLSFGLEHVIASYPELFELDSLAGVRYVLRPEYISRSRFDDMTIEQLEEELEHVRTARRLGRAEAAFATIKWRRRVQCAIVNKEFPQGNPLLDDRVLAQLIFDSLPLDRAVSPDDIRKLLPDEGRTVYPFSRAFFDKFPNLFFTFQPRPQQPYQVQRADLPRPERRTDFTNDELALSILSAAPPSLDPDRPINISTISVGLLDTVNEAIKRVGWEVLLKSYPQYFKVEKPEHGGKVDRFYFVGELAEQRRKEIAEGGKKIEPLTESQRLVARRGRTSA